MDGLEIDAKRERWRQYFVRALPDAGSQASEAAADAAMYVIVNGGTRDAAVEAGLAAGRRQPSPVTRSDHIPAVAEARSWPRNSAVVDAFERRSENLDGTFFQVWSLRLRPLGHDGRPGDEIVSVELRGRAVIGHVTKGDVVATPPGTYGTTRIVKELRNYTTNSTVEAKGRPFRRTRTFSRSLGLAFKVLGVIIALAVVVAIGLVVMFLLGSDVSLDM
jgi:hypothetical protein